LTTVERERVSLHECILRASAYWEDGGGEPFALALVPLTAVWYRWAGAPVRATPLASQVTDQGQRTFAVVVTYAFAVLGLLVIACLVLIAVVRIV
jgi:hypothetical protein